MKYNVHLHHFSKFVLQYEHQRRRRWLCTMCKNYQTFSNLWWYSSYMNLISCLESFSNPVPCFQKENKTIFKKLFISYLLLQNLRTMPHFVVAHSSGTFLNIVLIFSSKTFFKLFFPSFFLKRGKCAFYIVFTQMFFLTFPACF